jgi:hypothetical protein
MRHLLLLPLLCLLVPAASAQVTLTVQPTAAAANEGDTTRVPVTLFTADGNPTPTFIPFTVSQVGGDATNADYAPYTEFGQSFDGNLPAGFFIPPGVASGETILLPIPLEDDALVEGVETTVIQLSSTQATFTNDTFTLTINDNDDTPFSATIDYGTCPEPPATVAAGRTRCNVLVGGTSNVDDAQRFTVFLRIDGAGGESRIAFRGEIKPEAQQTIAPIPLPLKTNFSDPSGPFTVTVVVDTGSVPSPTASARDLDTITFIKAGGSSGPATIRVKPVAR